MPQQSGNPLLYSASKWIITLFTVLMVVTAALVGNGMFNRTDEWLLVGHMHLGNTLFAIAVVQMVLCYILFTRKAIGGGLMLASALLFVFTLAQIGLGYSTRNNMQAVAGWHIALGVALTGVGAMLTTILWMPSRRVNGGNTAG